LNILSRNERVIRFLLFAILLSIIILIPILEKGTYVSFYYILPFLVYGFTYCITIFIFGGIEKGKFNYLNQVVTIYLLANFASFITFFSVNGILRNQFRLDISFILLIVTGLNFPLLVYAIYNFIFNNLSPKTAIVFGDRNDWSDLIEEISEKSLRVIEIVDYLDLNSLGDLEIIEKFNDIDYIILTASNQYKKVNSLSLNVRVLSLHSLTEYYLRKIPLKMLVNYKEYYELTFVAPVRSKVAILIDFMISSILLFITAPILIGSALLILIFDNGPVFFMQERHGLYGKKFKIFKLRTMDLHPDGIVRTTKSGVLLRKLRINELPQLLNILKGDMSLIGPRPDVTSTYDFCISQLPFYNYRTFILPGITGNAQLNYKYIDSLDKEAFQERLSYDLHYIKNQTAFYYISIFLKTFESIFKAKGK
jgi:lipopolysaccharide/colanic/teichoic acid biosynthesis glycosyltransferase